MYTLTAKDAKTHAVAYGVDCYNQALTGDKAKTLSSAASDADHVPCAVYSVENHPADSRVNLDESGKVQCLTSRMGTGGGNVPMVMEEMPRVINLNKGDVQSKTILDPNGIAPSLYAGECRGGGGECYIMEPFCKSRRAQTADDATTWKHGKVANTLNTFDQGEARANELVVEGTPVLTASKASFFMNTDENLASTLVATDYKDPQLVAYSFDPGASRDVGVLFIEECGKTLTNGTCPGHHDGVVIATNEENPIAIDRAFFNQGQNALYEPQTYEDGTTPTLVARGPSAVAVRYIVRRLTPTECARLQGFADRWGDIEPKTEFSDEEYRFWLEVRNTHAAINGKAVKEYDKKQMLTWYNKLQTDSSEYKMWGNGIALPTALYVIQGISEAVKYGAQH